MGMMHFLIIVWKISIIKWQTSQNGRNALLSTKTSEAYHNKTDSTRSQNHCTPVLHAVDTAQSVSGEMYSVSFGSCVNALNGIVYNLYMLYAETIMSV